MTDLIRCAFTREDGARCVFGANHTVGYHHLDSGANVRMTVPSVPVAWCEIHNHEAATCECPEGAYEARHADCATVGQTCIAHTERAPSVPVESRDTACCVNTLREAANEVREVSFEGADILVERARDIEQMRAADRSAAVESGDTSYREALAQAILAWFHDGSTTEWPGEIDAYRSLAGHLLAAGGLGADRGSRFRWAEEAARLEAELDAERLAHAGTQGERDAGDDFAKGVREWLDVPDEPGWGLVVRDRIAELRADAAASDASLDHVRTSLVEHMDLASELSLPDVLTATWSVVDERDAARASLMAAEERGDAEARAVNSLREDLRQARAEAVRVMEHGEKSAANLRAELGRARAERGLYLDAAVAYSVQVAELKAELAGLRERAVEVEKYWRDWPSERRAKVHALSQFLAGAIEALAVEVESWRAAPEPAAPPKVSAIQFDAAKGAFFRLGSDNHLDPSSVLSLHWIGDDIHLRIQHEGEDQYAVVALNLGDRTDLVNALSQQRTVRDV